VIRRPAKRARLPASPGPADPTCGTSPASMRAEATCRSDTQTSVRRTSASPAADGIGTTIRHAENPQTPSPWGGIGVDRPYISGRDRCQPDFDNRSPGGIVPDQRLVVGCTVPAPTVPKTAPLPEPARTPLSKIKINKETPSQALLILLVAGVGFEPT
jgi:hypothetical protein